MKFEFNPTPFSVQSAHGAVQIDQSFDGHSTETVFIDCDQIETFIEWIQACAADASSSSKGEQ